MYLIACAPTRPIVEMDITSGDRPGHPLRIGGRGGGVPGDGRGYSRVVTEDGRRRPGVDRELETAIVELLDARAAGATICPSEAARRVSGDSWRELMEPARAAARRLVERGRIEITQRGRVVDPATASGPIRLRATR